MSSEGTLNVGDAVVENVNEPRRPWWLVGLALLGLVVVLLVGAVLIGRQLRPSVGVEPAPQAPVAAQATNPAAVAPGPTAPAAAPTAVSGATSAPPAGVRIANSPLEREIEDAFHRYLQVYSEAVLNLDTTRLSQVLDGEALQAVTEEVNDRRARARPLKVIEDDRLVAFGPVTDTQATLLDEYTSRSVVVDATTGHDLPRTSPPARVRQTYVLRKIGDVWKIVDGTREVLGER